MKKLSSILFVLVLTAISCFAQIRFEAAFRKVSKRFERDTVYLAYYQPYTYTYMENRIAQWASHDWVSVDTIGRYIQKQNGPWKYNYKSAEEGGVAGALLLVKTK